MENLEIIFENINIINLNKLLYKYLLLDLKNIKNSHFYDEKRDKDLRIEEIENLQNHFSIPGTGNINVERINLGIDVTDIMIIISYDKVYGDVVINFPTKHFLSSTSKLDDNNCKILYSKLETIYQEVEVERIIFGYEPGDDDMRIYCLDKRV